MDDPRETKAEFAYAFLCKIDRKNWDFASTWSQAAVFDDLMNCALSVHQ